MSREAVAGTGIIKSKELGSERKVTEKLTWKGTKEMSMIACTYDDEENRAAAFYESVMRRTRWMLSDAT